MTDSCFSGVAIQKRISEMGNSLILLVLIGCLLILFSFISPNFFTYKNLSRMISNQTIAGILAIAITPLIISRGLDLSFGSSISFSTVVMAVMYRTGNYSLVFIVITGLLLPVIVGLINGLLIEMFELNSLILTLAMGSILMALSKVVAGGGRSWAMLTDPLYNFARNTFLGIPYPIYILLGMVLITWFILAKTKTGNKIYFLGANPIAAKLSGMKVRKIKILLYIYFGIATGICAILMVAFSGTGYPYHGENLSLPVLSAVFLGGMTLVGGKGSVFNTILGVIVIAILFNGLSLLNLQFYFIRIFQGLSLILIVTSYQVRDKNMLKPPKETAVANGEKK